MRCTAHIATWSKRSKNASEPRYHSIQAAVADLLAHRPNSIARDGLGKKVDATTSETLFGNRNGVFAVIWANEADAKAGDLTRAQAVIRAR